MQSKAEVSVFLALILTVMVTLIFTVVESARTRAAQTYLSLAANSAMDSLYSQYHRELWDRYRLLGLEMYAPEEVTAEYYGFLKPYISKEDTANWYCLNVEEKGIGIDSCSLITDDNGAVFEDEVKSFMAVGIILDLAGADAVRSDLAQRESDVQTAELSGELETDSRTARKLNRELKDLETAVSVHNSCRRKTAESLRTGESPGEALAELDRCTGTVRTRVAEVESTARQLARETTLIRQKLEEKKAAGALTPEAYSRLDGQLKNYETYTDEQGEKRREIEDLKAALERNDRLMKDRLLPQAAAAEEYINNWEPEEILIGYLPPLEPGGEPIPIYDYTELDRQEVWRETRESFSSYESLSFTSGTGSADREKSGRLDKLSGLLKGDLLSLVLPEKDRLSTEKIDLSEAPSAMYAGEPTNLLNDQDYLLGKMTVDEYAMMMFSHIRSEKDSLSPAEVEYVLYGKESDTDNVSAVATELFLTRTGSNLGFLLTDPESLAVSAKLAAEVTGGGGGTPIVFIAQAAILILWANAQAVLDVRELFAGGRVPAVHSKATFTLSLDGMMSNFEQILKEAGTGKSDTGLNYEDNLRLIMMARPGNICDYRIMDMIQKNLRQEQSDFRMDRLYTASAVKVSARSRHLFSDWDESSAFRLSEDRNYPLTVYTSYSY